MEDIAAPPLGNDCGHFRIEITSRSDQGRPAIDLRRFRKYGPARFGA